MDPSEEFANDFAKSASEQPLNVDETPVYDKEAEPEVEPEAQRDTEETAEPDVVKSDENLDEDDEPYDPLADLDGISKSDPKSDNQNDASEAAVEEESRGHDEQGNVQSPQEATEHDEADDVDVPLFNEVIGWFLKTEAFQSPEFSDLPPAEKERFVLDQYNAQHGTNVDIPLNFYATTSYNKRFMRSNETKEFLIPVNPFCLRPDLLAPMSQQESDNYQRFLANEDNSLKSGKWDNFPIGSRLFIGNLAVNTLTKEDVFRVFNAYGEIAQVNLKKGFGFVQYMKAETCSRAIQGEKNVPLHNKCMHLEVSSHQVKRVMSMNEQNNNVRSRSRSPRRSDDHDFRSRSPSRLEKVEEVKFIVTSDADPNFTQKVGKRLIKDGITYTTEEVDTTFEGLSGEVATKAAYAGVLVVLVTCGNDLLNVTSYEKDSNGGIKFDEYTEISIDSSIEIILTAKAKKAADQPREFHLQQQQNQRNDRRNRNDRNSKGNDRGRNNNKRGNNNNYRNNDNQNRGRNNNDNYNDRGRNNNNNNNRKRMNDQYDVRYSKEQRYQQQHAPVQVSSYPRMPRNQSPQQQSPNLDQNQLLQQFANVDPNTLQSMLSLVQQYNQGQQGQGQQQSSYSRNQQSSNSQYYSGQQPSNTSGNPQLNAMMNQLQNAPTNPQLYANQNHNSYDNRHNQSLPPQQHQFNNYNNNGRQQPPQSNFANPLINRSPPNAVHANISSHNNNTNNSNNNNENQSQSSSDLFETLSRLRNNV